MAEPVVSFVVEKLGDLLIEEAKFLYKVSQQVEQMQAELRQMKCFLKDADIRQEEGESVRNWVSEIRDAAYHAEDVIETFALKVASKRRGGTQNVLKRYACIFKEGMALYKVGSEIEAINTKLSKLTSSLQTYGIKAITEAESPSAGYKRQQQRRRSYPHVVEDDIVGLEEDVEKLVEHLVNEEKRCRVVSVYGMGGLGKTTLAKKVYHHGDVRRHFHGFAWAYISQQCKIRDVLEGILVDLLSPSKEERGEMIKLRDEELAEKLYKAQQEKKFLVILDDIWSVEAWHNLKPAFPEGKVGSKILLTTRNREVALGIDPRGFLHQLQCLNEEESWDLFKKKAFPCEDGPDLRRDSNREKLGRKMVGQCGGLPLAIVVLGGLLATKTTLEEWDMVHENIKSHLRRGNGPEGQHQGVFEVLALSYNELPYYLKPCFLHLAHFPEDFEIPTKKLVQMWMAEGIVSSAVLQYEGRGKELMEDVAESYLDELIERCVVQVGKRGLTGRVKTCRLHDLMRDLCLFKAKQEHFVEVIDLRHENEPVDSSSSSIVNVAESNLNRVRRLAIYLGKDANRYFSFQHRTTPRLRSLSFFCARDFYMTNWQQMKSMFNDFKLLRVLDLEGFSSTEGKLPRAIGNLIHLRYLSLRNAYVTELPSSIANLMCLQTLDLRLENFKMKIPNVIWKMERLRHLYLPLLFTNESELELSNLSNLVTLTNFHSGTCVVTELIELTNLKKLGISFLKMFKELEPILKPPRVTLNHLRSLSLDIDSRVVEADLRLLFSSCHHLYKLYLEAHIRKLPEYHLFPPNLTKLTLSNSILEEDPMATLEKLTNLRILLLLRNAFIGKQMVCSANGFSQLKYLRLVSLDELEEWRVDEGAMPNLYGLQIVYCKKLKMVPDGLRFVTTLQELEIRGMPLEFTNRLGVVNGGGGEDLSKVEHVRSIVIKR